MDKVCKIPYEQLKELIRKSIIYDYYFDFSGRILEIPRDNQWLETYSTKITDSYLPRQLSWQSAGLKSPASMVRGHLVAPKGFRCVYLCAEQTLRRPTNSYGRNYWMKARYSLPGESCPCELVRNRLAMLLAE